MMNGYGVLSRNPMESVLVHLSPDTERILREKATRSGLTLESYLQRLADREAQAGNGTPHPGDDLSPEEFERCLDELSEGLPPLTSLPEDFSRADIYGEHD
jgi:hypothetical protein